MTISGVGDLSKNLGGERGGRRAFIMSCCVSSMEQWLFLVACIISHGSFACEWGGAPKEQGFIHSMCHIALHIRFISLSEDNLPCLRHGLF